MELTSPTRKANLGPLYVFVAGLLFSIGGLCMKVVVWHPFAINSARNIISLVIMALYMTKIGHRLRINRTVLIGAFCIAGTNNLFSFANKLTTAGNAIVLQFTAPIFVLLFTLFIMKRKPKKEDVVVCAIVFIGVLFFFIDSISQGNALGNFLSILSGVTYAGVFLINSFEKSDSLSSVVCGEMISSIIGLPWLLRTDFAGTPTTTWIGIFALGVFQLAIGYMFLTKGLETTPGITASLITGIEPVLNPIWVAVFYHELLTPLSLVGAAIVLVTVMIYNYRAARHTEAT